MPEQDDNFSPDVFNDTYLHMEIALPRGGGDQEDTQFAKVVKQLHDEEGQLIGVANNDNPSILDTQEYEVEFLDGHHESLSANVIAQHMITLIDEEGHRHLFLDDIIDFCGDDTAVYKEDAFVVMRNGVRHHKLRTTRGWQRLLCQWKDGSTNWVALKDMKNSYPVQVADYAVANHINDEPAFAWWVPDVFKKCQWILSKVQIQHLYPKDCCSSTSNN